MNDWITRTVATLLAVGFVSAFTPWGVVVAPLCLGGALLLTQVAMWRHRRAR